MNPDILWLEREIETHRRQAAHNGDMARRMERFLDAIRRDEGCPPSGDSETEASRSGASRKLYGAYTDTDS